jgi:putative hemolysin
VIGLATIEDILEEIVGEIRDEFDVEEEQPIQELKEGVLLVEGGVPLNDLAEQHNLPVEETSSYRTIAGFILSRLERIPRGGETVTHNGYRFTIVDMDGRRIAKVKIEKIEPPAPVLAQKESM